MIIFVINVIRVLANKTKRDPPAPTDRHGPGTLAVALERMKG